MSADTAASQRVRKDDHRADRRTLQVTTAVIGGTFALAAVGQSTYILAVFVPSWRPVSVLARLAANAVAMGVLLGTLRLTGQARRSSHTALGLGATLAGLTAAVARALLQIPFAAYPAFTPNALRVELVSGTAIATSAALLGTWVMTSRRRLRFEIRRAARSALAVEGALRALEDEEIRVRREVAEGLHSSMQQRLVLVTARLDSAVAMLTSAGADAHELTALRRARDEVEEVREHDVRHLSRLLYPDQLEVGLVPAVRALLRRVPSTIATRLDVDESLRALDDPVAPELSQAERLLAVRVVEEAVSNALRHGRPSQLEVQLGADDESIRLSVRDDGTGFDAASVTRSGTRKLADRLSIVGGTLDVVSTVGTGTCMAATLPVDALRTSR